jgi:tetratricopeptide (TPR) repeat protein
VWKVLARLLRPEPASAESGAGQQASVSGSGNLVVQIVGDGNAVVAGYAHLTLTRYLSRRLSPHERQGEAALLSPYSLAVPLEGRDGVLAEQWQWLRDRRRVSVRVLTGRAGTGKTRLALELCEQAVGAGWAAGFLTEGELERFPSQQNLSSWVWNRPTLAVVDDAAARATLLWSWLGELAEQREGEGPPFRLLLLERHADPSGGWWREAFGVGGGDAEAVRRLLDPVSGPYALPPLAGPQERRAVLTSILERSGSQVRLPEEGGTGDFDRWLAKISWGGEPLFLLMAGLVAARSEFGPALALSAPDLGRTIALNEIQRLHSIADSRGIDKHFFAHLAAYLTLCQGLSLDEMEEVVVEEKKALRYGSAGDPPVIGAALAAALPGETGSLSPILPDVVGEAVVLEALGVEGRPEKALSAVLRAARRAAVRVTASLVHLAQDYGAVRREPLDWFRRLAEERAEDLDALVALLAQLPDSTLVLREAASELTGRAVALARRENARDTLAMLLNDQSNRLSALGRHEAALPAGKEAVELFRELAAARPDAFRPDLALALNNLSIPLSALGQRKAAQAAGEKAVELYRELAAARPDAFRTGLARALSNLSAYLSALGQREDALAAGEEAVELYRELAAARPDVFRPDLASALNNLSSHLGDLGRDEDALAAGEEAVELYREFAAARPDAFQPDLAMALNNVQAPLSALGRSEDALAIAEEAAKIYRALAAARPDNFRPDLATALNNLSECLSALGRHEDAIAASQEAVRILSPYFLADPAAFGNRMNTMVRGYLQRTEKAERVPDLVLLDPVLPLLTSFRSSRPGP